jgi:hypothetical protein
MPVKASKEGAQAQLETKMESKMNFWVVFANELLKSILTKVDSTEFDKFDNLTKVDLGDFFSFLPQFKSMLEKDVLMFNDLDWILAMKGKPKQVSNQHENPCFLSRLAAKFIQEGQKDNCLDPLLVLVNKKICVTKCH